VENVETDLKELYADSSKHELKQKGDKHDVVDGAYSNDDALYNVL